MTVLIVILCILLVLFLLLQIRVGAEAEYSEDGFAVSAKIAGRKILLFPRPKKTRSQKEKAEAKKQKKQEKKARKAEKKAEKQRRKGGKKPPKPEEEPAPEKKGGTVGLVLQLLPVAVQALGALKRRIRIDPLTVHFTAGCTDAADTAILYGRSSGAAGVVVALLEENFDVRHRDVTIDMDFLSGESVIFVRAGISIKIGQILYLAVRYGLACLIVFLKRNRKPKAEKTAGADGTKQKKST